MKRFFLLLGLILITACSGKYDKPSEGRKIMLAQVVQGNGLTAEELPITKADAAFALAMRLSGKHEFVDKQTRDSVTKILIEQKASANLLGLAQYTNADDMAFLRVDRFANILRAEVQLVNVKDTTKRSRGEGYSFINFRDVGNDKALLDPSLLSAVQRAYAAASGDSNLYVKLGGNLGVKPVPTLAVAGISYEETPNARNWDLLDKKTVSSYSAVESICNASKDSREYVVYDIETRDSIYKVFKLFLVENYSLPTMSEIDAFRKFNIRYYIAGSYVQQQEQADLSLTLFEITEDNILKHNTVSSVIYKDDVVKFTQEFENMTKELLKIQKE